MSSSSLSLEVLADQPVPRHGLGSPSCWGFPPSCWGGGRPPEDGVFPPAWGGGTSPRAGRRLSWREASSTVVEGVFATNGRQPPGLSGGQLPCQGRQRPSPACWGGPASPSLLGGGQWRPDRRGVRALSPPGSTRLLRTHSCWGAASAPGRAAERGGAECQLLCSTAPLW